MDWRDFAVHMASAARGFLAVDGVDSTLDKATAAAVELVEGCDAAGVLVLGQGRVTTLAPTSSLVEESDQLQGQVGEGPCFDVARTKHPVFRIHDLSTETVRWRSYAPKAHALGIGSMMGFLLYTHGEEDLGALNLYSHRPGAFTDDSETAGWLLATHAAVALSAAREHAFMQRAVDTRHIIGEAMGILMAQHRISEQQAFEALRRYSQENNIKLRDVARHLCEHGTLKG
ncbi:GAF and ANTAR domain-containing protein [Streptomyces sp. SID14478]|uniref:GAF and ANTAR domain-containing protein n=1 Tax=Streptomyces sp. SID14478 TaxID=2706073 RepID=UPI00194384EA|nr:GAF and ANTAR domain-containing protein [Streptomyces sp. SID14478]